METPEIILSGTFKSLNLKHHFILTNAKEEEVARLLARLSEEIEPFAYEFAGVNSKKVKALVPSVSSFTQACEHLATVKQSEVKKALKEACAKDELLAAAEVLYISELFKKAGFEAKVKGTTSLTDKNDSNDPEQVAFVGNALGWFSIKKLSIDPSTQDWEVAGILSSINQTMISKMYDFLKLPVQTDEIMKATKGKRKSFGSLAEALKGIDTKNPRTVMMIAETIGYPLYIRPDILTSAYPDIKPPRVKGRLPKA